MEPTTNPNPLVGGWTPEENTSLLHLRETLERLCRVIENDLGAAGNELADKAVVQGYYELIQCAGWLFHVNVHPNDNNGETVLAWPREQVVAKAWEELNRANYELNKAKALYEGNFNFDTARAEMDLVDQGLSYLTPYPPGYPRQFGPHGDYRKAQKSLWSVIQYGASAMRAWLDGQAQGALPVAQGIFVSYGRCLRLVHVHTWFMSAHVILPTADFANFQTAFAQSLPDDSAVKRALTELQFIFGPNNGGTNQATYQFRFVLNSIAEAVQAENPHLYDVLRRLSDSWENLDSWGGFFDAIFEAP